MSTTMTTEYTLCRDAFRLSLNFDESSGDFICTCNPPLNDVINADVRRASIYWFKHIARGWARRRNDGSQVDSKAIRIDTGGGFKHGSTMRGTFVVPELTAQEVATANTKRQLMAKLKRGDKLIGNEVGLAIGFGLGEPYRNRSGAIALRPYSYRTSSFGTVRGFSRKKAA